MNNSRTIHKQALTDIRNILIPSSPIEESDIPKEEELLKILKEYKARQDYIIKKFDKIDATLERILLDH